MPSVKLPFSNYRGRAVVIIVVLATVAFGAACRSKAQNAAPPVSAETWAVVDGRQIKRDDVDKAYRRMRDTTQTLSDEEVLAAKLTLLNDLIVQDILLAKAAAAKIEIPQSELDTAYNNAKKNLTDEAFQQELSRRSVTPDDMREGLRRQLLTEKLINQEVGSKVTVSDKE